MRFPVVVACSVALCGPVVAQAAWEELVLRSRDAQGLSPGDGTMDLLVFGGEAQNELLSDTWQLNQGRWQQVTSGASAPAARSGHAMAFYPTTPTDLTVGETILFGGRVGSALSNETFRFNNGSWGTTEPATVPPPRTGHALVYDPLRHVLLMFGGEGAAGRLDDTWQWDGTDWTLLFPANSPSPRSEHRMAFDVGSGRVVLCGGVDPAATYNLYSDVWEWSGSDWTLRAPSGAPIADEGDFDIATNPGGGVVLFRSQNFWTSGSGFGWDTWVWDSSSAGWTGVASGDAMSPLMRYRPRLVTDAANGRALLHGGFRTFLAITSFPIPIRLLNWPLSDTWTWDGSGWSRIGGGLPSPREGAAYAFDRARGEMIVAGGENRCDLFEDAWALNGSSWRRLPEFSPQQPAQRVRGMAMAYDSIRDRMLLIGGDTCGIHTTNLARVWDGTSWSDSSATIPASYSGPPIQELTSASMAFDPIRDRMVIHGGWYVSAPFGGSESTDTWELDGVANQWVPPTPLAVAPDSRATLAYDESRGRVVAIDATGLWEWVGAAWIAVPTSGPAGTPFGENRTSLAHDRRRGVLLALNYSGLWELSGATWTQRATETFGLNFVDTSYVNLVYDDARNQMLIVNNTDRIWRDESIAPASYLIRGDGCGDFGLPELQVVNWPWIGNLLQVRVAPFPAGTVGVMGVGFAPLDPAISLAPIGIHCLLHSTIDVMLPIDASGTWTLGVPNAPSLVGSLFYNQAFVTSPWLGSSIGVVVSDAAVGMVGQR